MFWILHIISNSENTSVQGIESCSTGIQSCSGGAIDYSETTCEDAYNSGCHRYQRCTYRRQYCAPNTCVPMSNCPAIRNAECIGFVFRENFSLLNTTLNGACGTNQICENKTCRNKTCEELGNCEPEPEEVCEDIATPYGTPPDCRACPSADQTECSDGVCRLPAQCPTITQHRCPTTTPYGTYPNCRACSNASHIKCNGVCQAPPCNSCSGNTPYGTYPNCRACSNASHIKCNGVCQAPPCNSCSGNTPYGTYPNCRACQVASDTRCGTNCCSNGCNDAGTGCRGSGGGGGGSFTITLPPKPRNIRTNTCFNGNNTSCTDECTYALFKGKWECTRCTPPACSTDLNKVSGLTATPTPNVSGSISISWTSVAGATRYDIQYATRSNFSNARNTTSSTASKRITGLRVSALYYFRVKAKRQISRSSTIYSSRQWSSAVSARPNRRCSVSCGVGSLSSVVAGNASCPNNCPPNPTIQNPTYAVNPTTCAVNATFKYSGGTIYKTGITGVQEFGQKTYTGISTTDTGVNRYTLKENDYNKTYTFYAQSRRATDPVGLWGRTTKEFTTPNNPHPSANFTITPQENGTLQLQYAPDNTRPTLAGIRFKWAFSNTPQFHNGTNANSINPIVSFDTTEPTTITLTTTDTNISTTNGHCASSQTTIPTTQTSISQMEAPTIDALVYELSNAPACTPSAKITYTSKETQRKDTLTLFVGNTQVYTKRQNVSLAGTRSFNVPINPNTEYRAVITTQDFSTNPTKSASAPVEYSFTTPNATDYPTAYFTHNINADGTLSLTYAGNNSIQWHFTEAHSYIQGSKTSKSIQVSFSTHGKKQVALTASSSAPELNSCRYTRTIDVSPPLQTPLYPIIREAIPTP